MADNQNKDYENKEEALKEEELSVEENVEETTEEMSVAEFEELLIAKILDPTLELSRAMQDKLIYFISKNPEMLKHQQFYKMAQESGFAVAHKDEILSAIKELVESIKEDFPGYRNMKMQMILDDVGTVQKFKKVMEDVIWIEDGIIDIWVRAQNEKMFRRASVNDLDGECDFDSLTIRAEKEQFMIQYYSVGEFAERPTLLIRNKQEPKEYTFSVIMNMVGRSKSENGRMGYVGVCEHLDVGEYEIKLMTNLKKIGENGRIICE